MLRLCWKKIHNPPFIPPHSPELRPPLTQLAEQAVGAPEIRVDGQSALEQDGGALAAVCLVQDLAKQGFCRAAALYEIDGHSDCVGADGNGVG